MLEQKIEALKAEIESLQAETLDVVEQLRIKYLSRKGALNDLMEDFRNVAAEEKRIYGPKINEVKQMAFDKINGLRDALNANVNGNGNFDLDLTRTPYPVELGTRHPLSIVKNEIVEIFQRMRRSPRTCRTPRAARRSRRARGCSCRA